jgi:hypothetical protein
MRYHTELISGMFIIVLCALASCVPKPTTDKAEHTSSPSLEVIDTSQVTATPTTAITGIPASGKTPETTPTTPSGRLFVWWNGFPSGYGELNSDDGLFQVVQPASTAVVNPADSVALAFSNRSDKIAYLTYNEELSLNIADIKLENSIINKVEPLKWIIDKIDLGEEIHIQWGPQDKTVLVINDAGGSDSIVYSINENRADYLSDSCSILIGTDYGNGLELWCKLQNESEGYLILQGDGLLRREIKLPVDGSIVVKDVLFSNKGNSALIVTSDDKIMVMADTGEAVDTTIKSVDSLWNLPQSFYWSSDDSLALVYGVSILCPPFFNDIKVQHSERPCWHAVNPKTGEIIWYPTEELASAIDSTWDRINGTDYPAAISPDGNWLALSLREGGLRYLVLTHLYNGQTRVVGNFESAAMVWTP